MQVDSLEGTRLFLLFIDDFKRMSWIYFIKNKYEVFAYFQNILALVKRQSSHKSKVLRIDRGGEYMSNKFIIFCENYEIKHEFIAS